MKEIKFRGKAKTLNGHTSKVWEFGYNIWMGINVMATCEINNAKVDKDTIGQFTGMQDKNGNDVYEGDIIHLPSTEYLNGEMNGVVEFEDGSFVFKSLYSNTISDLAWVLRKRINGEPQAEIIGNVYDNQELIKNTAYDKHED